MNSDRSLVEAIATTLLSILCLSMIAVILAAAALVFGGCATIPPDARVPSYVGARVSGEASPWTPSPAETARAFASFEQRAHEVFVGVPRATIHRILSGVEVVYSMDQRCPSVDAQGHILCLRGLTWSPRGVWIYVDANRADVSSNALVHELVHVVMWQLYGTPDPDHEGPYPDLWHAEHTAWIDSVMSGLRQSQADQAPRRLTVTDWDRAAATGDRR